MLSIAGGTMIFFQVPPVMHVLPILVGYNVFLHRLLENGQESMETE